MENYKERKGKEEKYKEDKVILKGMEGKREKRKVLNYEC